MNSSGMGVIPAGGFKFAQRLPNGGLHTFVGTSEEDLVRQIIVFRSQAGLEPGDPLIEVKSQISGVAHSPLGDQRSLRERVTGWLANKQFGVIRYVSQEEANERAKLASECPYNTPNYADFCIECYNSTLR